MNNQALIIEDNKQNVQVLQMLLEKEGFKTLVKSTLSEFESVLSNQSNFDLVFLDVELPDGDAIEWLAKNRGRIKLSTGARIVGYSVHISEIQRARSAGFHSFLGKPIDSTSFSANLRRIISGESVWSRGA